MKSDEENGGKPREGTPRIPSEEVEEPLAVLKPNKALFFAVFVSFYVCLTIFCVFGVVLPILLTGDFSSGWISHKMANKNMQLFISASIWIFVLPLSVPLRNTGIINFYRYFIEVEPYLGFKKIVYKYNDVRVTVEGVRRVAISNINLPDWWHPWQRYKEKHWNGLCFSQRGHGENYAENLQKVLKILQQQAGEFNIKSGSIL